MSVTIIIANINKKEFLKGWAFGRELSSKSYIQGNIAIGVAMLTVDTSLCVNLEPPGGSWCGDRVIAVSDAGCANTEGFITSTEEDPNRTLYEMVQDEFRDISLETVAMICDRLEYVAEDLARQASEEIRTSRYPSDTLIWYLGNVVFRFGSISLEGALGRHLGEDWRQHYRERD